MGFNDVLKSHTHTLHTSLCFLAEINSWKYTSVLQRSSHPIDPLAYNQPARGGVTWMLSWRVHLAEPPAPCSQWDFDPLALSVRHPISRYDSVCVHLAPLESGGGDPEKATTNLPTLLSSISSSAFQCKHVGVLLLLFPLKNASLCHSQQINT